MQLTGMEMAETILRAKETAHTEYDFYPIFQNERHTSETNLNSTRNPVQLRLLIHSKLDFRFWRIRTEHGPANESIDLVPVRISFPLPGTRYTLDGGIIDVRITHSQMRLMLCAHRLPVN